MKYDWKNIVAFVVWECKICGQTLDRDGVGRHMHEEHGLQCVELGKDIAYSPNFEYPNILATANKG